MRIPTHPRFLYRFAGCSRGVTAVEFAFIAPVLLLMIMAIIEFSLIMLASSVMESATTVSARLGSTGYTTSGTSRSQTILNSIKAKAGTFIDTQKLTIQSKYYTQYSQINDPEPFTDSNHNGVRDSGEAFTDVNGNGQWDADMGLAGYGGAGDIVVYTVTYPWRILTPIVGRFIGKNGIYTITTHAVTKNEPF